MRYALVYGLISGSIVILTMIAGFELTAPDSFVHTLWYGYLLMLVVLTIMFVGIKRYRDVECGGVIRFGRAFALGLGMAACAALAYVVIFEIYLAVTEYRALDEMVARARGDERAQLEGMLYNPLVRASFVFIELFPVGFLVALVSALLLRNPKLLPATR
ncbi:MAG: hypothetical protein QOI38_2526 [Sphingomonadales bacterium]|jgi:hypothetical protein|nr:hypothetical protein [Sphingomonadales bacterium]